MATTSSAQKLIMSEAYSAPIISPNSPLIFMHIPKSGGMSLFASLSKILGTSIADLYDHSPQRLMGVGMLMQDNTKAAYSGHFSFGLHQWLTRPCYYASFVRDPVARMVSLYYFLRGHWPEIHDRLTHLRVIGNKPPPEFHQDFTDWFIEKTERAENFFSCPSAELDNAMVRRFSGHGLNPEPCPKEALGKAIDNIERYFSFVGLVERYSESLDTMATVLGLSGLKEHNVNVTRKKPKGDQPLSTTVMTKIRDKNQLDLALHEWVGRNFDSRKNNPKSIAVLGFGRKDYKCMPLWRGVGGGRGKAVKEAGL
jgi:hypothetical protein